MTFRIISLSLLLMTCSGGYSRYVITVNIQKAWDNILELKIDSALELLETEEKSNPSNPFPFYYHHYALFLQALITGDVSEYKNFNRQAETLATAIRNSDPHQPEYLYFLSSMHLQKTFLNIYHGDYWSGIRNLYIACRMADQNSKKWPGFDPNLKIEGITELLISSVPENYKWIFSWLGMTAELPDAIYKVEQYFRRCSSREKPEALIILAIAYGQFLPDMEKAYRVLKEGDQAYLNKIVLQLVMAFYASKTGHAAEAVRLLEPVNQQGSIWCGQAALLTGIAKLNMLEEDAYTYLKDFLDRNKGTNLVRTACHKLSLYYFIQGDTALYLNYRQMVLSEGSDILATDIQATAEASVHSLPNVHLLKARLLFDAGMYDRTLEVLQDIHVNEMDTEKHKIEYIYRFARVCHKLSMIDRAKELYSKVISEDTYPDLYFAPYSALQLGLIAEQEGELGEAKRLFNTCLEINRGQYRSGIAREAQNGLYRLDRLMDY